MSTIKLATSMSLTRFKNIHVIAVSCEMYNLKVCIVTNSATFKRRVLRQRQPPSPSVMLPICAVIMCEIMPHIFWPFSIGSASKEHYWVASCERAPKSHYEHFVSLNETKEVPIFASLVALQLIIKKLIHINTHF